MDHTIAFDAPADTLYAVFGDRDYGKACSGTTGGGSAIRLVEFRCGADGIDVTFGRCCPARDLPASSAPVRSAGHGDHA